MGIGKAIALAFADAGANVVVADVNEAVGSETVAELKSKGVDSIFCKTDVRDRASIEQTVQATLDRFGKIDILMNNAGIGRPGSAVDMSEKDWQDVIDINLTGVVHMSQIVG